ncbi:MULTISPECIES: hypothetical protein [unclassified Streptomyces]|uniref:hypothetical protein n=1 Tax=unclassified Streptomyces TaxID=2593676 RepID=UPI00234A1C99|nr:hypothetical protein [Streptomyces sp. M92]WCN02822.1 hypothetical protein M6G08_12410 [Streptomyces sp. M92]
MTQNEPNVHIGNAQGATFAVGDNANVTSHYGATAARDQAAEELLRAVRELRADLARIQRTEQTDQVDTALADTEEEITRTGAVPEGRLARLRALLEDSQTVLSLFASFGTVAGLLGM